MAQYIYTMNGVGKVVPPKKHILKDIYLSFYPGAKIGVLGYNGAGKSTLLRIMAGIDTEIEGEARPMPGINIGYLPQEPQLDESKDVRGNVMEGLGDIADKLARFNEISEAFADPDADFEALLAEQAELRIESRRVTEALTALPESQREALTLAYFGGYSQSEIAALVGAPLGTVKTRMRDGLSRLRAEMGVAS